MKMHADKLLPNVEVVIGVTSTPSYGVFFCSNSNGTQLCPSSATTKPSQVKFIAIAVAVAVAVAVAITIAIAIAIAIRGCYLLRQCMLCK